jgi:hypothetical protein
MDDFNEMLSMGGAKGLEGELEGELESLRAVLDLSCSAPWQQPLDFGNQGAIGGLADLTALDWSQVPAEAGAGGKTEPEAPEKPEGPCPRRRGLKKKIQRERDASARCRARLAAGADRGMKFISVGDGSAYLWMCSEGHQFVADFDSVRPADALACMVCDWKAKAKLTGR